MKKIILMLIFMSSIVQIKALNDIAIHATNISVILCTLLQEREFIRHMKEIETEYHQCNHQHHIKYGMPYKIDKSATHIYEFNISTVPPILLAAASFDYQTAGDYQKASYYTLLSIGALGIRQRILANKILCEYTNVNAKLQLLTPTVD